MRNSQGVSSAQVGGFLSTTEPFHPGHDPLERPAIWELSVALPQPTDPKFFAHRMPRRNNIYESLALHYPASPPMMDPSFLQVMEQFGMPDHVLRPPVMPRAPARALERLNAQYPAPPAPLLEVHRL